MSVNVPRRRRAYRAFVVLAIITFIVSLVDIMFLDSALFWGVMGAYILLFVLGLILLIGAVAGPSMRELDGLQNERTLKCDHCHHVFAYHASANSHHRKGSVFNCPECGTPGRLPRAGARAHKGIIPGGKAHGNKFACSDCGDEWFIGAIGHKPKKKVGFDACLNCGAEGTVSTTA